MANPKVTSATNAPFPTAVEIYFDSSMLNDSKLTDPENYLFDHGAYATDVHVINNLKVLVLVENLFEYDNFTVTISNVTNISAEVIDPAFNSATFGIIRSNMPSYALVVSATSGALKSGTQAVQIKQDNDYWYIMTESGIDVIDRVSLGNVGFVLDRSGFNAIHVST